MARILVVTNGKHALRSSVAAFRFAGHRVIVRETMTPVAVLRTAPDLLVIAPGEPEAVRGFVTALRAEFMLQLLPVIIAGAEGDVQTLLPPVAPAADTVVLPAPFDDTALFDAAHFFVSEAVDSRHVA